MRVTRRVLLVPLGGVSASDRMKTYLLNDELLVLLLRDR
jgi:hypothetical protein